MRILFIGTVLFSKSALEQLISFKADIVGVVTKEQSNFNADFVDITPLCREFSIPYKTVNDINHPNNIKWIKDQAPDIIYCFGWSSLLKRELLHSAPMGVIGFHPAALPYNKGRHPIIWALALGLKETASTFFFIDEGADSGDILSQERIIIEDFDNASTLYNKITNTAINQITEFTQSLSSGNHTRIPQSKMGNIWSKRGRKDGSIDFRMHTQTIHNLVRALTKPYVGAHIEYLGKEVKVWITQPAICNDSNIEPGKVLNIKENIITVKTADAAINIIEHGFEQLPEIGSYL
jgi:methionyl-tRNA formyltransferase